MSPLLGEVVTWDIATQDIPYHDVIDALREAGLDPDAASELSPKSAFKRACKTLKENRSIDRLNQSGKKKGGPVIYQFTRKELEDGKLEFDYECQMELDAETGSVSCQEDGVLEEQTQKLVDFAKETRTGQDITRLVQKLFNDNADLFPINPRKGVAYFVPIEHREFTAKVEAFMSSLGGEICRFPVPRGDEKGEESVRGAIKAGIATLVDELNGAVSEWDDTTRGSTMERAKNRWTTIYNKVDAYSEYLGAEKRSLQDALDKAKDELYRRITELRPEDGVSEDSAA